MPNYPNGLKNPTDNPKKLSSVGFFNPLGSPWANQFIIEICRRKIVSILYVGSIFHNF